MLANAAAALLLLVCIGLAVRNRQLRGELFDARWETMRAVQKEHRNRKVHVHVVRPAEPSRGGDAA